MGSRACLSAAIASSYRRAVKQAIPPDPWHPSGIEGIQPLPQVNLLDPSIRISRGDKEVAIIASYPGIVWVQIDGLFDFRSRLIVLPSKQVNEPKHAVCEAVGLVEDDCTLRELIRLGERIRAIGRPTGHVVEEQAPCCVRMRPRAGGVELHCSYGAGKRLLVVCPGIFGRQCVGAKHEVIGPERGRAQAHRPIAPRCLHPAADGRCSGTSGLVLQGKDVAHFPIIPFGPQVIPGVSVHQLGGNPDTVDRPTNAAFHANEIATAR